MLDDLSGNIYNLQLTNNSMKENFWNKINSNWLDKNKDNINKKWQPKRWVSIINDQLKAKWITPISKTQVEDIFLNLMQLEETELMEMVNNKKTPFLIRVCIREMISKDKWFSAINTMLDRGHWKSVQKIEQQWETTLNIINNDDQKLLDTVFNKNIWQEKKL